MKVKEFLKDIKIGDCFILSTYNGVDMFQLVSKDEFIHIPVWTNLTVFIEYKRNFEYISNNYSNNKIYPIIIDIFNTIKEELNDIRNYIMDLIRNSVSEKIRIYC